MASAVSAQDGDVVTETEVLIIAGIYRNNKRFFLIL